MARQNVSTGAPWEKKVGYCRAVRTGPHISVSGTAPVGEDGEVVGIGDAYAQAKRCIEIIAVALAEAGAGLEDGEHEKVLGRFYRGGDTNKAGAGLGLSIVKSIANLHSARVELEESELGGLRVNVRFGADRI